MANLRQVYSSTVILSAVGYPQKKQSNLGKLVSHALHCGILEIRKTKLNRRRETLKPTFVKIVLSQIQSSFEKCHSTKIFFSRFMRKKKFSTVLNKVLMFCLFAVEVNLASASFYSFTRSLVRSHSVARLLIRSAVIRRSATISFSSNSEFFVPCLILMK